MRTVAGAKAYARKILLVDDDGCFTKPFSPLRLLRKIDEVLAERDVSTLSR